VVGCGGGLLRATTYGCLSCAFLVVARAIITMAVRTELGMVCHASIRRPRSLSLGGSVLLLSCLLSGYDSGDL
jgi:hypothetical protein